MLLMCKRRYFARLKILFMVCQKCVGGKKTPNRRSLMSVALRWKKNNGGVLIPYKIREPEENHRQTHYLSCTCSAFENKAFIRQSTAAFLLHLCSASNLCDCVRFVFVWMCVHFCILACCHFTSLLFVFAVLVWACLCSRLWKSFECRHTHILLHVCDVICLN